MSEHFIVAIDQGHLRIYAERRTPEQFTSGLEQVEAMDFPLGKKAYTASDTSMAGRFQSSKHQSRAPGAPAGIEGGRSGMSVDERLPMKNETDRRRADQLAQEIEHFFTQRPEVTWDFAAGPELHRAVLEQLSPSVRQRLRRAVSKDLVNQPTSTLREQFATSGAH
jgi:hypothetical protein